VQKGRRQDPN